jgi:voltage-gated potassium channel
LITAVSLLVLIVAIGTIGFAVLEPTLRDNYFESFWLTIVTVTTVGYGDVVPMTEEGKALAVMILLSGVGAGIYTLTLVFQLVVTDKLRAELGLPPRRTRMKDHYIVCGYGMVGRQVVEQLSCKNEKFLIIERDRDKVEMLVDKGFEVLHGDAEDEETLIKANISSAQGLITTMRDGQNLVAIIAAKNLNPSLYIVSEVEEDKNIGKLKRVGADLTINCHEMGAKIMVDDARHTLVDPVCQVEVSTLKQKFELEDDGCTFTFCSKECLDAFRKHPERFKKAWHHNQICHLPPKK